MKLYTIARNNKIYKVKAKDCDTAMKAVEDACVKDSEDFYTVAYTKNGVNQIIAVRASSEQEAKQKFMDYMQKKARKVEFVGITQGKEDKPGMPVIDTCVKNVTDGVSTLFFGDVTLSKDTDNKSATISWDSKHKVSVESALKFSNDLNNAIKEARK